jgi:hypothetical protein
MHDAAIINVVIVFIILNCSLQIFGKGGEVRFAIRLRCVVGLSMTLSGIGFGC